MVSVADEPAKTEIVSSVAEEVSITMETESYVAEVASIFKEALQDEFCPDDYNEYIIDRVRVTTGQAFVTETEIERTLKVKVKSFDIQMESIESIERDTEKNLMPSLKSNLLRK